MCDSESQISESKSSSSGSVHEPRVKRWWLIASIILLAILLLPYLFYRTTSDLRKLSRSDFPSIAFSNIEMKPDASTFFRLATWNIAHGRGSGDDNWKEGGDEKLERIKQIAATIRTFDADVVVLNEVDFSATWSGGMDQAELIAQHSGYPVCIKQANLDFGFIYGRWFFGNVILSRLPVSAEKVVELKPLADWESWLVGNKRGVSCSIKVSPHHSVSVVGLHLESRGEPIRVQQIDDVARHCGQLFSPIIIAGDLNTTPQNFPNSQTNADGISAFDKLIEQTQFAFRPDAVTGTESLTFSTINPTALIDWILLSHELKRIDQAVVDNQLSDHRPVIATIELDPDSR